MLRVSSRSEMHVEIVAERGMSRGRFLLVIGGQLCECVINLSVDDEVVFNPAGLILRGLNAQKPASVFEHLQWISVDDFCDAIGDSGDAVTQVYLAGGDINHFDFGRVEAIASGGQHKKAYRQRCWHVQRATPE